MLLRLLRFIRGYVRFEIISPFEERFLNLSVRKHIMLWDTGRKDGRAYASMYQKDYRKIRPVARAAKARLRIVRRYGVPVFVRQYRGRFGVAVGALAFMLTVFMMSQFIWSVEITGLNRISKTELTEDLREEGFYVGAFKPSLDFDEVTRNVMIRNKDVGWMAINVTGSYASVELKEEQLPPAVEDIDTPCNIKASCDGTVMRSKIREGKSLIIEGSGVVKDQLLVSGVITDAFGGTQFVHSDAVIEAKTEHTAVFEIEKKREDPVFSGEVRERKKLNFLGLEVPLGFVSPSMPDYADRSRQENLRFLDVSMPVGITTERLAGFEKREQTLDSVQAEKILKKQSDLFEAFSLSQCEVAERENSYSDTNDKYRLEVIYSCIEDISYQSPIYLENEQ
ncbi:MAG: sporulation protein YqfD [Ruminococcus sp.]|nr:sporulation protein YqfD [Ruminococcus sp.]